MQETERLLSPLKERVKSGASPILRRGRRNALGKKLVAAAPNVLACRRRVEIIIRSRVEMIIRRVEMTIRRVEMMIRRMTIRRVEMTIRRRVEMTIRRRVEIIIILLGHKNIQRR